MLPLFPIQWQSQIYSTTTFLQLLIKRRLKFNFHINIFQILSKMDLIFPFCKTTDKIEIDNAITTLDYNKSVGPNSIHTKVFKVLKNDVSSQISETFNISFSVFSLVLKPASLSPCIRRIPS